MKKLCCIVSSNPEDRPLRIPVYPENEFDTVVAIIDSSCCKITDILLLMAEEALSIQSSYFNVPVIDSFL